MRASTSPLGGATIEVTGKSDETIDRMTIIGECTINTVPVDTTGSNVTAVSAVTAVLGIPLVVYRPRLYRTARNKWMKITAGT